MVTTAGTAYIPCNSPGQSHQAKESVASCVDSLMSSLLNTVWIILLQFICLRL